MRTLTGGANVPRHGEERLSVHAELQGGRVCVWQVVVRAGAIAEWPWGFVCDAYSRVEQQRTAVRWRVDACFGHGNNANLKLAPSCQMEAVHKGR